MKNLLLKNSLMLILIVGLGGCTKEKENEKERQNTGGNVSALRDVLQDAAPPVQTFTIDAGQYNSITGERGTRLRVPENAFTDINGNPVSGSVQIRLQEIFEPGDMILANKPTTSDGKLLVSGGELYFNASQNGNDLQIASNKEIQFEVPAQSIDPQMQIFTGSGSGDSFDWTLNPDIDLSKCADSSRMSYCFGLDSMINWINCDYFYNYPGTLTTVDLQVPNGYDDTNTLVYAYVPSINSITAVRSYSNQLFSINGGYRMPVGLNVIFIAIHVDSSNNFEVAYANTTIVNNHLEVLNFQSKTYAQVIQIIQGL